MKKTLYRARKVAFAGFLLATTSLYASDAKAEPVSLFIAGIQLGVFTGTAAGASVLTGALAVGYTIGGTLAALAASTFGSLLLSAALSVGISALTAALQKSPAAPQPSQRFTNLRRTVQDRKKGYGIYRDGGAVGLWTTRNGGRFYTIMIHTGEIDGFETRYFDEREVPLVDIPGKTWKGTPGDEQFESGQRVEEFTGAPGQTTPQLITENISDFPAGGRYENIAGATLGVFNVNERDFNRVYPTGREPVYTAVIRATKCYDPRTDTTVFTKNAALIIADWITSPDGLNRTVDWDLVEIEADASDVIVTDRDDNDIAKWELGGPYYFNERRDDVRAKLGVACDAFFYETRDGHVGFYVGRWIEPTVTIEQSVIQTIQITEGQPGTDKNNSMTVEYVEPREAYRELESAAYQIVGETDYEQETIKAHFVPNHNQAVRVSKRLLLNRRAEYRVTGTLKLGGMRLIGQRFFVLNYPEIGFSNQYFEVNKLKLGEDRMTFDFEAMSVDPTDFDFDAAVEEGAPSLTTVLTEETSLSEPTGVTVKALGPAGSIYLLVEWDDPGFATLRHEVRYRQVGGEYTTAFASSGEYSYTTAIVQDNVFYEAEVRAVSQTGQESDWVVATPASIKAGVDTVPPDPVQSATIVEETVDIRISWVPPTSTNYAGVVIRRNTFNDFASADVIVTKFGGPDEYLDNTTETGNSYFYWVSAINASVVESTELATTPTFLLV